MTEPKWQRPAPRPLRVMYKYLKADYAQRMVRNGEIRITTLYECRSWDHPELGDKDEGKGVIRQTFRDREFTEDDPMPGPLGSMINAKNIRVGTISGSWSIEMADIYMYCTSRVASRKLMAQFGYDACVRITNPWRFTLCISEQMARQGLIPFVPFTELGVSNPNILMLGIGDINDCFYEPRDREWLSGQPAQWLIKEPTFAHQEEIRTVWEPAARPIKAEVVESLPAASYCEFYDFPE